MSSSSVRAICPGCQNPLRIPRELLGQPVKCKQCGTIVRTKAPPQSAAVPVPAGYPQAAVPVPAVYPQGQAYPQAAAPYAPPPGYGYPAAVAAPNPLEMETTSSAAKNYRGRGRYKKGGGNKTALYLTIAFGLFVIVGLTAAGIYLPGYVKKHRADQAVADSTTPVQSQKVATPTIASTPSAPSFGPMPRRMLFMQLNNYLYLNPLTSATPTGRGFGPDRTRAVAKRLAYDWRVNTEKENNQLYVLSDIGPVTDVRAPYRNVLTETYEKFFESSRAQDRLLVYFGGHIAEVEGKAYLVPIEGDLEEVSTLIPLQDFYTKLAASPAQQKVVVWDVCRYNPQRGKTRKGSEPMSESLEKALVAVPPGVEAVLTCAKDECALEFFSQQVPGETSDYSITGSSFLTAAIFVANKNKNKAKGVSPTDAYPVQEWVDAIGKRVEAVAKSMPQEDGKSMVQKPKVVGTPKSEPVAYNPNEAMPVRFELPQPPKGASLELVTAIRDEIRLPSLLKSDSEDNSLASFPFPADKLDPFKTTVTLEQILKDKEKYNFEATVAEAFDKIRLVWDGKAAGGEAKAEIRRVFEGETSDAAKKTIKEDQIYPALAILELEEVISSLTKLASERETAPKRWQANYDYALAQAKARLAFMNEYNLLLGQIFTPEILPALDREKAGHTGWALATKEKMKSKKDMQTLRDESRELYAQIIEQYKGTPWEIQAKREKGIALGLEWQPYSPGGKLMD